MEQDKTPIQEEQFIEINRILSEKNTKKNISVSKEIINTSLIETFRVWHKGTNDLYIDGDMTVLVLRDKNRESDPNRKGVRTMLIQEKCDEFMYRLNSPGIIKRLPVKDGLSTDIQGK